MRTKYDINSKQLSKAFLFPVGSYIGEKETQLNLSIFPCVFVHWLLFWRLGR